ncbi:MarR family protein [Leptospira ryugenii]|uniref:MarR family protein n=1 Tax=Leptospira ryugenii TaxID=1917863 RepID=A0A2P2DZH1_9LEPT|nr:MarR family transcriptional regulator [Leptospira ryugenii]GBF50031.1 MarR family protein [Leptospira ryugenii]
MKEKSIGIEIWRHFLTMHHEIIQQIERDLRASDCISLVWYDVLIVLVRSGKDSLSLKELLADLVLTKSAVSKLLDRMEVAHMIRRRQSSEDGRSLRIEILPKGKEAVKVAWPIYKNGIQKYFLDAIPKESHSDILQMFIGIRSLNHSTQSFSKFTPE